MTKRVITEEDRKELTWDILSSDNKKFFKDYRMKHSDIWLTREMELLVIEDMATQHIVHSVKMLERAKQKGTLAYTGLTLELAERKKK
jgi:hypothetical protein